MKDLRLNTAAAYYDLLKPEFDEPHVPETTVCMYCAADIFVKRAVKDNKRPLLDFCSRAHVKKYREKWTSEARQMRGVAS